MIKLAVIYCCNDFIQEIEYELKNNPKYNVRTLFFKQSLNGRINKFKAKFALRKILSWSEIAFFEWGTEPVIIATSMKKKCKYIVRIHRFEIFRDRKKINWQKIDHIIFVSDYYRELFLQLLANENRSYLATQTTKIRNIINPKYSFIKNNGEKTYTLAIIGNVDENKRIYELLFAFAKMKEQLPQLKLLIVGKTKEDYFLAVTRLIEKLLLQDSVTFLGYTNDLLPIYQKTDIVISNSIQESFSVVVQEARLCGCHTLAHTWGSSTEFLPESSLFLEPQTLVDKVIEFYQLPGEIIHKERQIIAQQARVDNDLKHIITKINTVIQGVYNN